MHHIRLLQADKLDLRPEITHENVSVTNPVGGLVHLSMMCRNLKLVMKGVELPCNAYVLCFAGYRLILGMDWMSRYEVVLDCERRVVCVRSHNYRDLMVCCEPNASVLRSYLYSLDLS